MLEQRKEREQMYLLQYVLHLLLCVCYNYSKVFDQKGYRLCYTCHFVYSNYNKASERKEELEQRHLLQAVLHLSLCMFQLQQGVGAEGGTGTEAPVTACVTPVTLCVSVTARCRSRKRNWNRSTFYRLCYTYHLVCSSYSKVSEQKEELEQKHLLQLVLHLSPCVFQLQQGVGSEGGTGTEAPVTACVTLV